MQEGAQGAGLAGLPLNGLRLPDEAGVLRLEQEILRVKLTEFVLHLDSRGRAAAPVAARLGADLLPLMVRPGRVRAHAPGGAGMTTPKGAGALSKAQAPPGAPARPGGL